MSFFYDLNNKLNAIRELPSTTHGQLNERDMSRAAKGYEKYGKQGMEALAKAGREGKALDPVRAKYDKYDEGVEEGLGDMARKVGGAVKKIGGAVLDKVGHGSDADMIRDLQKKMGMPQTGMKPGAEPNPKQIKEKMSPAKAKSFAALAEPKDKITFADKIAGAKKEVDEMLGDVAAEAMKNALGGHSTKSLKAASSKDVDADRKSGVSPQYSTQQVKGELKRRGEQVASEDEDLNPFTNYKKPRTDNPRVGSVERGHKHDIEHTATGRKVTRRVDPAGISVGADDDKPADGEKRGRGRPKGAPKGPERVTSKATKHKDGRKTNEGADHGQAQQIYDELADIRAIAKQAQRGGEFPQGYASRLESVLYAAMTLIKNQQSGGAQVREEELDEKAVSKKQQRFMGMVHAAQKGEKPASKEVAKTAKGMGKKDAEDFAATKHKGLPEKAKSDDAPKKKKEKTQEAGGTDTPTASSGFSYGKGIYDSINREIEEMIAESMSVTMSMNNDTMNGGPGKNLTVNATDEDAVKLASILKMAGMGGGESSCGCGQPGCDCAQQGMDEAYGDTDATQNDPDYPTETETSADPFQYSGGINKPKSTGQTTVPVIASQEDRQGTYAEAEEDAIKRMMEMAGVKKKEVDEEKTDEGNKFTGNLAKARADGKKEADLDGDGDLEKVKESIFDLTNQWRAYKG
jgi:hypothetical protein